MTRSNAPLSILVVDDSPGDRALCRHLLNEEAATGFIIREAESGAEALARIALEKPDCILLDYILPDLNGVGFLAELAAKSDGLCVPVIMLTGYGSERVVIEAVRAGAADYLSKDRLTGSALARAIRTAIEKWELHEAIEAHRRSVEKLNEDLQHRNTEIESFYHTLSHELKTPLFSAREFVSIVLDGVAGAVNEAQREYLEIAIESCDQMRGLVDDLIDATRLDTGNVSIVAREGSVTELIAKIAASASPVAERAQVRLVHTVEPALPNVVFDKGRITQVLMNLLNNAIKFTPPGGMVTLAAARDPVEPDEVTLFVSDTGRGIAPDELASIFKRLYQTERSDALIKGGLGLGLYISQELIKLHGSFIAVESELGRGSRFSFNLCPSLRSPQSIEARKSP